MPTYEALNTQIEAVKSEITASLAASTYSAQDLVYIAKTLETLGNLLGINDLVAASADAQASLNNALESILDGSAPANVGKLYVGSEAQSFETYAGLQDAALIASIDTPDYAQIAFQNKGSGVNSSTDFIAYADNGVDDSGYIDMGITSQNFNDPDFTITGASDGYIFMEAPRVLTASVSLKSLASNVATLTTSVAHGFRVGMPVTITGVDGVFNGSYTITAVTPLTFSYAKTNIDVSEASVNPVGTAVAGKLGRGNLVLATSDLGSQNKIVFAAGGLASDNTQMVITPDVNVHIEIPTPSTSPTTGALTVVGGVGISGDVNIQGSITFAGSGTEVTTQNLSVAEPIIFVGDNNQTDSVDLGLVGEYTVSGNTKYAGIVRDATDGAIKAFTGASTKPTTGVVNFAQAGLTYADFYVRSLILSQNPTVALGAATKQYVDATQASLEIGQLMGAY